MNKLLSANFMRIKKNKTFWSGVIFMFGLGIFFPVRRYVDMVQTGWVNNLDDGFYFCAVLIAIVMAVFCSMFIGTEYSDGTIRNKIIVGQKRSAVYLANAVTSSMVSISGQPSGFAYPASKFAVNGLTVSLARELGPKGIRVNAVAPGITETDMMKAVPKEVIDPLIAKIPLRRLGQPEDIANAFVFLASDEASYITGVVLSVDGMARS